MPEFSRSRAPGAKQPRGLLKVLPEGTAVLDLVRFTRFERDPQIKGIKGGGARPVMSASCCPGASRCGWSTSARPSRSTTPLPGGGRPSTPGRIAPPPATLRRLVWEPLARHLPNGTTTVIHRPRRRALLRPLGGVARRPARDGAPGAVRPGHRPARAVPARPPHRAEGRRTRRTAGLLLAVGGVAYDQEPRPVDDERTRLQLLAARPAEIERAGENGWADLPGTLQELDAVSRLAAAVMSCGSRAPRRARRGCSKNCPAPDGPTSPPTASSPIPPSDRC